MSEILKLKFLEYINTNIDKTLSTRKDTELRIATYNIHYFTNVFEDTDTYNYIINDIKNINANFIGLQEFILGNIVKINKKLFINLNNFYQDIEKLGYNKTTLCNSVPSWFSAVYGNILLVKNYCDNSICQKLDESIYTFEKSKINKIVSGIHEGIQETRCFIKVHIQYNNYNIILYVTHLDVSTEDNRLIQIQYIISDSEKYKQTNDVVFIMGDFNTINIKEQPDLSWQTNPFLKDNGIVINTLLKNGFFDCHKDNPAIMTTWSNIRVDFIFCNKKINGPFRAEYYWTISSDHLPVILTITPNTVFS